MVKRNSGVLDDLLLNLTVPSFDGGLNTVENPLRLKASESPFIQNVTLTETGRLLGRNGSETLAGTAGQNDAIWDWWDADNNRRQAVWSNGDLYETTTGTPVLVTAACYTSSPTILIGRFDFDGLLYWSDGVQYRVFDPIASTEGAVTLSAGTGYLTAIGFTCATVYTGFVVVGNTTAAIAPAAAVYEPYNYRWSLLEDPTSWPGSNAQAVGYGFGGHVSALSGMGIADAGVPPDKSIIVLKSLEGVYLYTGGLGEMTEAILPIPGGILDPETLEMVERSGRANEDGTVRTYATFLCTDRQVWWTDGINCGRYSDNIRNALQGAIETALTANPNQRFTAVNSSNDRQYLVDIGNGTQYVYQYDLGVWTFYLGMPSGFWSAGFDASGLPAVYCAARTLNSLVQCLIPGQLLDDTNIIQIYYFSPFLHMNQEDIWKFFHWLYVTFVTDVGQVEAAVVTNFGQDTPGCTYTFKPSSESDLFVLDESTLDGPDVLAGVNQNSNYGTFEECLRLSVPVPGYQDIGACEMSQGVNVQVQLAQTQISGHFEILSFELDYILRGRKRGIVPQ